MKSFFGSNSSKSADYISIKKQLRDIELDLQNNVQLSHCRNKYKQIEEWKNKLPCREQIKIQERISAFQKRYKRYGFGEENEMMPTSYLARHSPEKSDYSTEVDTRSPARSNVDVFCDGHQHVSSVSHSGGEVKTKFNEDNQSNYGGPSKTVDVYNRGTWQQPPTVSPMSTLEDGFHNLSTESKAFSLPGSTMELPRNSNTSSTNFSYENEKHRLHSSQTSNQNFARVHSIGVNVNQFANQQKYSNTINKTQVEENDETTTDRMGRCEHQQVSASNRRPSAGDQEYAIGTTRGSFRDQSCLAREERMDWESQTTIEDSSGTGTRQEETYHDKSMHEKPSPNERKQDYRQRGRGRTRLGQQNITTRVHHQELEMSSSEQNRETVGKPYNNEHMQEHQSVPNQNTESRPRSHDQEELGTIEKVFRDKPKSYPEFERLAATKQHCENARESKNYDHTREQQFSLQHTEQAPRNYRNDHRNRKFSDGVQSTAKVSHQIKTRSKSDNQVEEPPTKTNQEFERLRTEKQDIESSRVGYGNEDRSRINNQEQERLIERYKNNKVAREQQERFALQNVEKVDSHSEYRFSHSAVEVPQQMETRSSSHHHREEILETAENRPKIYQGSDRSTRKQYVGSARKVSQPYGNETRSGNRHQEHGREETVNYQREQRDRSIIGLEEKSGNSGSILNRSWEPQSHFKDRSRNSQGGYQQHGRSPGFEYSFFQNDHYSQHNFNYQQGRKQNCDHANVQMQESHEVAKEAIEEEPLEILDVHQYFRDDFDLKTLDNSVDKMTQIETVEKWARNFDNRVNNFFGSNYSIEYFVLDEKLMNLIEHLDKLRCKDDKIATARKIEVIEYIKELHATLDSRATDD